MSSGQGQEEHVPAGTTAPKPPPRRLSRVHLASLAVAIVLSLASFVGMQEFATVAFSAIYAYFLSKVAYPALPNPKPSLRLDGTNGKLIQKYVHLTAVIGQLLPGAYIIIAGVIMGDKEGVTPAARHLFLLVSQIVMEGVVFCGGCSLPVFMFVPIFYNAMRIRSIVGWIGSEFANGGVGRAYGKWIAFGNLTIWCFNLFGLLLPVFLPRAFKIYYHS